MICDISSSSINSSNSSTAAAAVVEVVIVLGGRVTATATLAVVDSRQCAFSIFNHYRIIDKKILKRCFVYDGEEDRWTCSEIAKSFKKK